MTRSSSLRTLLLQIRHNPQVRREEHSSFARYSELDASQIHILNVFDTPSFGTEVVDGYDALFVGGASEASVLEPDANPFLDSGIRLMQYCADQDIPVFASCFGFQLAAVAFGREILRDKKDFEQGSIPIYLTDQASSDPLFHDTPNPFLAVSVHKEKALKAPDGFETLAYTESCCHAFRIPDKRFWAFQFHPEVDRNILMERLTIYKETYTDDDEHLRRVLAAVQETPESNILIRKFVERVLM